MVKRFLIILRPFESIFAATCEPMLSLVLVYNGIACTVLPFGVYDTSSNMLVLIVSGYICDC